MRYARIYPWRRTRRFRAPSNRPEAFFVAQFSAGYTTNMFGFDLRQGQLTFKNMSDIINLVKPDAVGLCCIQAKIIKIIERNKSDIWVGPRQQWSTATTASN